MYTRPVLAVILMLVLFPIVSHGEVWSLGDDLSGTRNPNGMWSFGWRDATGQPFMLFGNNTPLNGCELWWWRDSQMNPGVWHNFTTFLVTASHPMITHPIRPISIPARPRRASSAGQRHRT